MCEVTAVRRHGKNTDYLVLRAWKKELLFSR